MRKTLKLSKYAYLYQPHLTTTLFPKTVIPPTFFPLRLKSDKASSDKTGKEEECKLAKNDASGKPNKDAASGKPNKDAAPGKPNKDAGPSKSKKEEAVSGKLKKGAVTDKPKTDAVADKSKTDAVADKPEKKVPPKDETVISGGPKCEPRTPKMTGSKPKVKKQTCESIMCKKNGVKKMKRKVPLTKIQGGLLSCPEKKKPPVEQLSGRYKKYSLFVALPLIAILTLLIFSNRMEEDRLEYKQYEHMYRRTKRFNFGDGNRSAFHNSYFNALPPDGYEDEIDEEGKGQEPETEKDKKTRLQEFQKVFKKWKKFADKRDAQNKKHLAN